MLVQQAWARRYFMTRLHCTTFICTMLIYTPERNQGMVSSR